jgi:hypothetical protein
MTVFCCLTMIFVLEDKLVGHYLPSNRDNLNLNSHNLIALTSITSSDVPPQPPQTPVTDTTPVTDATLVANDDSEVNTNV